MPASNQLIDWDTINSEISAGNFLSSTTPPTGHLVPDWGTFISYIDVDNTTAFSNNTIQPYSVLIAHAVVVGTPTSLNLVAFPGFRMSGTWTLPGPGSPFLAVEVTWNDTGAIHTLAGTVTGDDNTDETASGIPVNFSVRVQGSSGAWGPYATSATVNTA
jgi:hypothetical protein